jgi:hypothetical protein
LTVRSLLVVAACTGHVLLAKKLVKRGQIELEQHAANGAITGHASETNAQACARC